MSIELYNAAAALDNCIQWQDHTADNIASSAPGRKQTIVTMEQVQSFDGIMSEPRLKVSTDFSAGKPYTTGNPTDVAISGEHGFFSFNNGEVLSRDGEFHWNTENQLVDKYEQVVDGAGGPISKSTSGGSVTIDRQGRVFQGNQEIGRISLTKIEDKTGLVRQGPMFVAGPGVKTEKMDPSEVNLLSGALEKPNRHKINEMTNLMQITNMTQSIQSVMKQYDAMNDSIIKGLTKA